MYILGGSEVIALADLAKQMVEISEFPADRRAIDIADYYGDFSEISSALGWTPRKTQRGTIKFRLDYYREFFAMCRHRLRTACEDS